MTVSVETFRSTMALFPGAVNVITTGAGELRRGITATAVCSVTDSPPSILVCVNKKTGTCAEITRSGRFSVQLLGEEQTSLAMTFAGTDGLTGAEKFDNIEWSECPLGLPQIDDAIASISCEVSTSTEAGSHQVFIGRIEHMQTGQGEALVYAQSKFHKLANVHQR
ncbi:4-hydroxyphenylacetate 3-monooxygenase reductase component [Pseudovibrio axinellae]|uniref:4-hydroxyphenylacetate 3-monooxygenase reductase component n=1 Tax=Pseudovibrio axinellae TaxID=989403 RepID=A0A165SZ14_9HYPH|nr:flavin reductase family protein [Pseudovibrio axinellae]KZL05049.1 4-hydroxyphenylacetate 3-monooxygenase reductase component [Pseudovibrio axinellae]SER65944.1 4-hydroxyphenylacetate 3-monooxygenase reductase component [Pseudovibrio axinellae]